MSYYEVAELPRNVSKRGRLAFLGALLALASVALAEAPDRHITANFKDAELWSPAAPRASARPWLHACSNPAPMW